MPASRELPPDRRAPDWRAGDAPWSAERPVSAIRPGDHGWLPYGCAEERDRVIGPFVREGLLTGEKVVYVTDAPAGRLPGLHRIDADACVRARRLRVIARGDACLDRAGVFAPAKLLDTIAREIGDAFGQGFRAVRVTMDHTPLLTAGPRGLGRVLDCEDGVGDAVSPSTMAMAICQVDRRVCPPDRLAALRDAHEVRVEVNPAFEDGVLKLVRTYAPDGLRVEGELDAARHAAFDEQLAALHPRGGAVHLDLSRLGFIDLGALDLLARHAARLRGALVLDHLPPAVADLIETVGRDRLPGAGRGPGEAARRAPGTPCPGD